MPQLSATDLLEPKGELNAPALWPRKDINVVSANLSEYLNEGYGKAAALSEADQHEAARQWAYYRAYKDVYKRLLAMPSTVQTSDQGSSSYLLTQMEHVGELADAALAAHQALVEVVIVAEFPAVPASVCAPTTYGF